MGLLPKFGPLQSGYDHFFGFRTAATDYFRDGEGRNEGLWADDTPVKREGYLTDVLGQRAVEGIAEFAQSRAPFLLSLHFTAPHWPWEGPGAAAESKRLHEGKPSLSHGDGGSPRIYREMVEAMDRQIGRVLAALDSHGLAENTIVILTRDNGGERFPRNWPFAGPKLELLAGGLRVPTVMTWPAKIPAGRTSEQVAVTMDWLSTLLPAAGASPDPQFPTGGMNGLPQVTGVASPAARQMFWRYKGNAPQAVRDGDLRYLNINENTFRFDLAADPMERASLKERRKDDYRRLAQAWFA